MLNLVGNAIKFTHEGSVLLCVATECDPADAGRVRLHCEVADTGVGIPADSIDNLFQAYAQAQASTSRHYGGTGLGLSICKQIVERMGGKIGVESPPEGGATFWFRAVLGVGRAIARETAEVATASNTADAMTESEVAAEPPPGRAMRILVADDNEINQMVAVEMLRSAGWETEVANNGRQAVDAASEGGFDLVLMDCQMPEMDGFEATRALRAMEAAGATLRRGGGALPIIALTARAVLGDRQECLETGMTDYVTKPINPAALFAAVGRALHVETPPRIRAGGRAATPSVATTVDEDAAAVIDVAQLTDRCGGDTAFVADLLSAFVTNARERVTLLAESIDRGAHTDVMQTAHNLKGAAGNVSATLLSQAVAELESAASTRQSTEYAQLQSRVDLELTRCEEAVNALLAQA